MVSNNFLAFFSVDLLGFILHRGMRIKATIVAYAGLRVKTHDQYQVGGGYI